MGFYRVPHHKITWDTMGWRMRQKKIAQVAALGSTYLAKKKWKALMKNEPRINWLEKWWNLMCDDLPTSWRLVACRNYRGLHKSDNQSVGKPCTLDHRFLDRCARCPVSKAAEDLCMQHRAKQGSRILSSVSVSFSLRTPVASWLRKTLTNKPKQTLNQKLLIFHFVERKKK